MALIPAICPQCGGTLNIEGDHDAFVCSFCGTPIITQKAVDLYNADKMTKCEADILYDKAMSFIKLDKIDKAKYTFYDMTQKIPGDFRGWLGLAKLGVQYELHAKFISKVCCICGGSENQIDFEESSSSNKIYMDTLTNLGLYTIHKIGCMPKDLSDATQGDHYYIKEVVFSYVDYLECMENIKNAKKVASPESLNEILLVEESLNKKNNELLEQAKKIFVETTDWITKESKRYKEQAEFLGNTFGPGSFTQMDIIKHLTGEDIFKTKSISSTYNHSTTTYSNVKIIGVSPNIIFYTYKYKTITKTPSQTHKDTHHCLGRHKINIDDDVRVTMDGFKIPGFFVSKPYHFTE